MKINDGLGCTGVIGVPGVAGMSGLTGVTVVIGASKKDEVSSYSANRLFLGVGGTKSGF